MASISPQPPVRPPRKGFQPPGSKTTPSFNSGPGSDHGHHKHLGRVTIWILFGLAAITGSLAGLTLVYSVDLPQIHDLERYRPSTTTELYDQKGRSFGSFALERRIIVNYDDFAPVLRQAVISIEDKNFQSHWGINVFRVAGALWHDISSHGRAQGASTLTMQLARNLFLSSERTTARKVQEAYLSIQIERSFTKQQIFTLYGNQIYLGHGMYGFEAASEFYFSKHASELNLAEAALLAGLPKGPVAYSPLLNPEKALRRRNLVIGEMETDKLITREQADAARNAPLGLHIAQPEMSVAPWFVEEVRRELEKQFGTEEVHEAGLRVETTLDLDLQQVANHAVQDGVATYEHRRGWKGAAVNIIAQGQDPDSYKHPDWVMRVHAGGYTHALVTSVLPLEIRARIGSIDIVMTPEDWKWTGQAHGDALVKPGDIIYVKLSDAMEGTARKAALEQDSGAEGSLMAMDNTSGDVLAMVGGRDYALSQFNRATQSQRQTGSSFKPYVYTAAIEDGVKPDDIIVDAPVSFGSYTPHNYEGDYRGAMTVQNAFAESRNIPAYLPVALGAVEITLEEQVASYSVFPNDGVRVTPRLVRKVTNSDGIALWEQPPAVKEVTSQQTARTMMRLLREVMRSGTGGAAAVLKHPLGGKTGTTSDYTDAWFMGFSPSVTCGVWVGFDSRQSLGEKETGAKAALPIWMTFMREAIKDKDDEVFLGDPPHTPNLQARSEEPAAPSAAPTKPLPPQPSQSLIPGNKPLLKPISPQPNQPSSQGNKPPVTAKPSASQLGQVFNQATPNGQTRPVVPQVGQPSSPGSNSPTKQDPPRAQPVTPQARGAIPPATPSTNPVKPATNTPQSPAPKLSAQPANPPAPRRSSPGVLPPLPPDPDGDIVHPTPKPKPAQPPQG